MPKDVLEMKKETKFLSELEKRLEGVNKKDKSKIVEKYKTIIDEEIKKKKSINSILKKLGTAEDVAKKEVKIIKRKKKIKQLLKI